MTVFKPSFPPDNCRTTSTGSLVVDAIMCPPSALRQISILWWQRSTAASGPLWRQNPRRRSGCRHHCGPAPPVPVGLVRQFVPTQQLQTAIHQLLRRQRGTLGPQPCNDGPYAREVEIADVVSGEVNAFDQRAAVDPLLASVPALNRRRVEQILPHVANGQRQAIEPGPGEGENPRPGAWCQPPSRPGF